MSIAPSLVCRAFTAALVSSALASGAAEDGSQVAFRPKSWSVHGQIQTSNSFIANSGNRWTGVGVGFSYRFIPRVEAGLTLLGHRMVTKGQVTGGAEVVANARVLMYRNTDLALFFDAGAGIVLSEKHFPQGGTSFNFTEHAGLGVWIPVAEDWSIATSIRYQHVSNADYLGDDRNPGIDGLTGTVGVIWEIGD